MSDAEGSPSPRGSSVPKSVAVRLYVMKREINDRLDTGIGELNRYSEAAWSKGRLL